MPSDSEYLDLQYYLVGSNPIGQGGLKSRNPLDDPVQRQVITYRDGDPAFSILVRLLTVVHGTYRDGGLASLIVFEYRLFCTDNRQIKSMNTSFKFEEAANTSPTSKPSVVAFAPFSKKPERGNPSTADIKTKQYTGFDVGIDAAQAAKLGLKLGKEKEIFHVQQYFDLGKANLSVDKNASRFHGVWWNIQQNKSQKHGIPSVFRVGMLISRASDADFTARFQLEIDAGIWHKLGEWRDLICGGLEPDDPIIFSPSKEGKKMQGKYDGVDATALDDLVDDLTLTLPPSYGLVIFPIDATTTTGATAAATASSTTTEGGSSQAAGTSMQKERGERRIEKINALIKEGDEEGLRTVLGQNENSKPFVPRPNEWYECIVESRRKGRPYLDLVLAHGNDEMRVTWLNHATFLHDTSDSPDCEFVVKELLSKYSDLGTVIGQGGRSPIHQAAHSGNKVILDLLLQAGDKEKVKQTLKKEDISDLTPVGLAVQEDKLAALELLLDFALNNFTLNLANEAAIKLAVKRKRESIFHTLLKRSSDLLTVDLVCDIVKSSSQSIWDLLCEIATTNSQETLANSKATLQSHFSNPKVICAAISTGKVKMVEYLLANDSTLTTATLANDEPLLQHNSSNDNAISQEIRDLFVPQIVRLEDLRKIKHLLATKDGRQREVWLDLTVFNQNSNGYVAFINTLRSMKSLGDIRGYKKPSDAQDNNKSPSDVKGTKKSLGHAISDLDLKYGIDFESCIRYVDFPDLDQITLEQFHDLNSPREDALVVLNWLADKGVRKVIELRVPDSWESPHSEEIIEKAIKNFNVEVLDWRRTDLSIMSIKKGAETTIRELHLYSSGNWTALSHWTGPDGVETLGELEKLRINIIKDKISPERINEQKEEIGRKLEKIKAGRDFKAIENSWRTARPVRHSGIDKRSKQTMPELVTKLNCFLESYKSFQLRKSTSKIPDDCSRPVKVAIIDNGVDESAFECGKIAKGISFVQRADDSSKSKMKESPWWLSIDAHGTQMAKFICDLDPNCKLYIAKVCEEKNDITLQRVIDAVKWATAHEVDIISMSLCLYETSEEFKTLVEKAISDDTVLICSTADEGNNNQQVWPAAYRDVIAIAACNAYGKLTQWSTDTAAQYHFPGEDITTAYAPYADSLHQVSGSSVATALAAGVASLVLACHWHNKDKDKAKRKIAIVEKMFERMAAPAEGKNGLGASTQKYVKPWVVFRESLGAGYEVDWFQKHIV